MTKGSPHRSRPPNPIRWQRMPEVIIEIAQGRTQDQKRALIKEITEAVVRTCSVPADAVTVIIHENPLTDKGKGGVPFSER
jgi:4-oxalocrotonate tautomerase